MQTNTWLDKVASREFPFAATCSEKEETYFIEQVTECTFLETQSRSVNYMLVARICKNLKQNKAVLVVVFKVKAEYIWF